MRLFHRTPPVPSTPASMAAVLNDPQRRREHYPRPSAAFVLAVARMLTSGELVMERRQPVTHVDMRRHV